MGIEELRSFVILAGHLHFGRAAQALHVSQPALTKQMNRLEEAVGGKLLARGKQGSKLTTLGERFLPRAKTLVATFDQLMADTRQEAEGRGGRLRIGSGSYTLDLVPRLIVKLRALEPRIEVSLRDFSTTEQLASLQQEKLDLGFMRLPLPATARDLAVLPVMSGQLALVLPKQGFPNRTVKLSECRDQPFVILSRERSRGLYELTLKLCAQHGFHPRIAQEVSELPTALALVRAGMGLLIIPDCFRGAQLNGARMQSLPGRAAAWAVGAVWRRNDTNPALHRFLKLVEAEVAGGKVV